MVQILPSLKRNAKPASQFQHCWKFCQPCFQRYSTHECCSSSPEKKTFETEANSKCSEWSCLSSWRTIARLVFALLLPAIDEPTAPTWTGPFCFGAYLLRTPQGSWFFENVAKTRDDRWRLLVRAYQGLKIIQNYELQLMAQRIRLKCPEGHPSTDLTGTCQSVNLNQMSL